MIGSVFSLEEGFPCPRSLIHPSPGFRSPEFTRAWLLAGGEHALLEGAVATHTGMTTEEIEKIVTERITTARHPKTGRLHTEMVCQPMLEVPANLPHTAGCGRGLQAS